jgi:hypothetical protein
MATTEQILTSIDRKLEIIAAVLLMSASIQSASTTTERIHALNELGPSPSEIGRYVGKQENYVSATLQKVRKKRARKS